MLHSCYLFWSVLNAPTHSVWIVSIPSHVQIAKKILPLILMDNVKQMTESIALTVAALYLLRTVIPLAKLARTIAPSLVLVVIIMQLLT